MPQSAASNYRRAGAPPPLEPMPFAQRWYGKALLVLLGVVLLSLSFAPINQFYLAWVGLVPWLVVVRNCRSTWRAVGWSWIAGTSFFLANMWWIAAVTGPGMVALMAILGLYWAAAGWIFRVAGLLEKGQSSGTEVASPLLSTLGIATAWVGVEWLRGTWPFQGLRWLYLGHTQSPALHLCQIADFSGELGVSFWVALVNAWVALLVIHRLRFKPMIASGCTVLVLTLGVLGYGFWRFAQFSSVTSPGPSVMVVQPNIPQSNTGDKGAPPEEIVDFHMRATQQALEQYPDVDLVVWSETMMPPLDAEARSYFRGSQFGNLMARAHDGIVAMARQYHVAFLVGASYWGGFEDRADGFPRISDSRNTAYYFEPNAISASARYDKIHLVPFGEYIPFKDSAPWLYHLLISLGPPDMESYQLTRGSKSRLTVFPLRNNAGRSWRFVAPICFEDIDGPLVAEMFRGPDGSKRADLIINITNDGWFKYNEMPQHLQAAVFRDIEERAPTARSVNTGISGFIDSMGRPYDLLPADSAGVSVARMTVDARTTFFTRHGEIFGQIWAGATAFMALFGVFRWGMRRRAARASRRSASDA